MKSNKMIIKILYAIIGFVLLISMITKVDATSYSVDSEDNELTSFESIKTNTVIASDTSGEVATIHKFFNIGIPVIKFVTSIVGLLLLLKGIISIIKKETKKGIICIIIAIILFCVIGVFEIVFHAPVNIQP